MATGSSYQVEELDSNTGLFLCKDQALPPIPSHFINRTVQTTEENGLSPLKKSAAK